MKYLLNLLLSLALLLGLCACTAVPAQSADTPDSAAEPSARAEDAVPARAAEIPDDLGPVLEGITAEVHIATAGASLRAAQQACLLMDWCCQTEMDEAAIRAAAEAFIAEKSEEERIEFAAQLAAVLQSVERLQGDEGAEILDDIGGAEGTLWPWQDAPMEKLTALAEAVSMEEYSAAYYDANT